MSPPSPIKIESPPDGVLVAVVILGIIIGLTGGFALFHPGIGPYLVRAIPPLANPAIAWGALVAGFSASSLVGYMIALRSRKARANDPVPEADSASVAGNPQGPSKGLRRGDLVATAIVLIAVGALAALDPDTGSLLAFAVFFIGYAPVTPLALRAPIANGVLRYFYGLTAVPLFIVLFITLLHLLFSEYPTLGDTFSQSQVRGGKNAGMGHALLVTVPTAILFWIWYWIVRLLDQATSRMRPAARAAASVTVVLAASAVALFFAHRAGLIGSEEWRTSQRTHGGATPSSDWMAGTRFDEEFKKWSRNWFYPANVEGRCEAQVEKYRADWKVIPANARYYFYFGLGKQDYDRYDRDLRSQGYSLEWVTQFKDCAGNDRYQANWLKR